MSVSEAGFPRFKDFQECSILISIVVRTLSNIPKLTPMVPLKTAQDLKKRVQKFRQSNNLFKTKRYKPFWDWLNLV